MAATCFPLKSLLQNGWIRALRPPLKPIPRHDAAGLPRRPGKDRNLRALGPSDKQEDSSRAIGLQPELATALKTTERLNVL